MSCVTLTSGLCRGCMDNVGGIKRAYVASVGDYANISAVTVAGGAITDFTLATGTDVKYVALRPNKDTGNYVETINVSSSNGTIFYSGVLSTSFGKMDEDKLQTIASMGKGEVAIIFVDQNDNKWALGGFRWSTSPTAVETDVDNGAIIGGTSFQTGTAKGDMNGAALTFTCEMRSPVIPVDPASGGTLETKLAAADTECDAA